MHIQSDPSKQQPIINRRIRKTQIHHQELKRPN
uniref:Uncharacterized protein n=1 Tax=Arundo donax TaxID=35708 RepID=A0A0A9HQZ0_ARUDO